jgi:hypothetical protein
MQSSPITTFRSKLVSSFAAILLFVGITANAAGNLNNPDSGYLLCVNTKTKMVTHPGSSKCPKGTTALVLGQKGKDGIPGLTGAAGLNGLDGKDGKDGKTLWNGVKDPESTWGAPGDMFINSVTKTLFGPKNLDGTWPIGVSMIGPKGDQGPIGLTGATGPQGPGGSGPAGATGPAGVAGANGSAGIGVINTVMSNFDEIVKIDNSLAGNIWDRGNQKLRITFDVKNRTNTNLDIVPFENMSLQIWVNYFDASGVKMDDLDEPVLTWEQTPAGQTILPFGQKTFDVIVDNTSNFASLPAGATYFSLTFRGQNLTSDSSWNTYFANGINGKYGTVVSFAASKYWD